MGRLPAGALNHVAVSVTMALNRLHEEHGMVTSGELAEATGLDELVVETVVADLRAHEIAAVEEVTPENVALIQDRARATRAARYVADVVRGYKYRYADEDQLQEAIADAVAKTGALVNREVNLTGGAGRIDLVAIIPDDGQVSIVGIEVKVNGTPAQVTRQLRRYCTSNHIDSLVLVTNRPRHVAAGAGLAKPFQAAVVVTPF